MPDYNRVVPTNIAGDLPDRTLDRLGEYVADAGNGLGSALSATMDMRTLTADTRTTRSVTRVAIPTSSTLIRITEPKTVVVAITNDSGSNLYISLDGGAEDTLADGNTWTTTTPDDITMRAATSNQTAIIFTEVYS